MTGSHDDGQLRLPAIDRSAFGMPAPPPQPRPPNPSATEALWDPLVRSGARALAPPSAADRWQRHVAAARGSVTERAADPAGAWRSPPGPDAARPEAGRSGRSRSPLRLDPKPPPPLKPLSGVFTSPRDVEGRLARSGRVLYPQAMQLLLGLIGSLCSPGEEAGSYAKAVESALKLAEAEFHARVERNHRQERVEAAATANNYHELLSSLHGELTSEREQRRRVESQDAAMVATLQQELALEKQQRVAVQESLRSALAVKRMAREDAEAAARKLSEPAGPATAVATGNRVAGLEAQVTALQAEVARLKAALAAATKATKAPVLQFAQPEPEPEPLTEEAAATKIQAAHRGNTARKSAEGGGAGGGAKGRPGQPTQLRAAQPRAKPADTPLNALNASMGQRSGSLDRSGFEPRAELQRSGGMGASGGGAYAGDANVR